MSYFYRHLPVNNVDEISKMADSNGLPQILNHLTPLFGCRVNVVDKGKQVFAFGVHVFSQYSPVLQLLFPCSLTSFGSSAHCVSPDIHKVGCVYCAGLDNTQRKNCVGFFPYGFAKESPLFFWWPGTCPSRAGADLTAASPAIELGCHPARLHGSLTTRPRRVTINCTTTRTKL